MSRALTIILLLVSLGLHAQQYQLAKPLVQVEGGSFFEKNTTVRCDFRLKGASIHYTLDGSEPTLNSRTYRGPIKLKWSKTIKVKAFKEGFQASETVTRQLFKVRYSQLSVKLSPLPKAPYAAQAGETLTDHKEGSFNFRDGNWVGYNKGPVTIDIDAGMTRFKSIITLSTLTSPGSWIMNPDKITAIFSNDGEHWEESKDFKIVPIEANDSAKKAYYQVNKGRPFRYIRITVHPMAKLPDWHPGKGQPGWVFIDEILIQ